MAEEGPHRLLFFVYKESSSLQGEISPLFSLFFPTSLFSTEVFTVPSLQFVSKSCCVNAMRDAMLIPLFLMLFSFGEGMALSLTAFSCHLFQRWVILSYLGWPHLQIHTFTGCHLFVSLSYGKRGFDFKGNYLPD